VETIVKSRLGELAGVFHPDAISLSARQVAAYSGDVRQALLILQPRCRAKTNPPRSRPRRTRQNGSLENLGHRAWKQQQQQQQQQL